MIKAFVALPRDIDDDEKKVTVRAHHKKPFEPSVLISQQPKGKPPERPKAGEAAAAPAGHDKKPMKPELPDFSKKFSRPGRAFDDVKLFFSAHHKLLAVVVVLALLMGALGSGMGRGVTGAVLGEVDPLVSCQQNITALASENAALTTALDATKKLNTQLNQQLATMAAKDTALTACQNDLTTVKGNLTRTEADLSKAQDDISSLQSTVVGYDVLAQNYANRYCCQLNLLGFNYKSYTVVDNNVVCLTSGTKTITCNTG